MSFSFSVSKSGFHTTVSVPDSAMPRTVPQHHLGHDSGYLFLWKHFVPAFGVVYDLLSVLPEELN